MQLSHAWLCRPRDKGTHPTPMTIARGPLAQACMDLNTHHREPSAQSVAAAARLSCYSSQGTCCDQRRMRTTLHASHPHLLQPQGG